MQTKTILIASILLSNFTMLPAQAQVKQVRVDELPDGIHVYSSSPPRPNVPVDVKYAGADIFVFEKQGNQLVGEGFTANSDSFFACFVGTARGSEISATVFMPPEMGKSNAPWTKGQHKFSLNGFSKISIDQMRYGKSSVPRCKKIAKEFNVSFIESIDYTKLESKPDRQSINKGLNSPTADYMKSVMGIPGKLTKDCSKITNPALEKLIVTENVGPFRVTGLKPAVAALERIFAQVKQDHPALYDKLGSAGMVCVRTLRNGSVYSNHSWGTAIDITIDEKLDTRGDNLTQYGLKVLYPYFQAEGFYWGSSFRTEDSMHFEASTELIEKWRASGQL